MAVAKTLVKNAVGAWPVFSQDDFDDLLQECLIHWLKKRNRYRSDRGTNTRTFMAKVIRNKLLDLKREKETQKRKVAHEAISLNEPVSNEADSITLQDLLQDERSLTHFTDLDKRIALERALKELTPMQREICDLQSRDVPVVDIAEILRTPRSTIYDELERIRKIFEKKGLGDDAGD